MLSLIGRGQIADRIGKMPSTADRIRAFTNYGDNYIEEEEEARKRFLPGESDEEDEDEEDGDDDDE